MIESRILGALKSASEARDENVPAKRADFFDYTYVQNIHEWFAELFQATGNLL